MPWALAAAGVAAVGSYYASKAGNKSKGSTSASYADPFTQYGGQYNTPQFKEQLGGTTLDASLSGLGNLKDLASGNFGNLGGALGASFSGQKMFGGGGGGGAGGGMGGIMGLGKEALNLKNDPYDDAFIEKSLGRMTEGIHGEAVVQQQNVMDYLAKAGIDPSSPAGVRAMANLGRGAESEAAHSREGFGIQMSQEKLANLRQLAEEETQLRGISRSSMATERAAMSGLAGARAMAGAQRYSAGMGLQGDLARLQFGAMSQLGSGDAWRNYAAPYPQQTSGTSSGQQNTGSPYAAAAAGALGGYQSAGGRNSGNAGKNNSTSGGTWT